MLGQRRATGLTAVGLIALGAAVAQSFGRFTYGVLLPAVRDDLGISNTLAGAIGTANVGAYLVGTILVAWATGTYRLLTVMRVGFVLSTIGLLLAAASPGPWTLGIAMFLAGLGGAFIWIPSPVIAASAMAPERRAIAVGLMGTGIGFGIVFTGQLSSIVRSTMGDDSWRTVYAIEAAIAIVVLICTSLFIGHDQDQPTTRGGLGGFVALRRMRGWLPLTSAYTAFGFMYLLVLAFLTTRLEDDSGWSGSQAALAFTLMGVSIMFGGPIATTLAVRIGSRNVLAAAFGLWGLLAVTILPGWLGTTLAAALALGLLFGGLPTLITFYVVENTTADDFGPSYSAATLAFGIAQMASPQVGGLIADLTGSFTGVFVLSSIVAIVGMTAALRLPRHTS